MQLVHKVTAKTVVKSIVAIAALLHVVYVHITLNKTTKQLRETEAVYGVLYDINQQLVATQQQINDTLYSANQSVVAQALDQAANLSAQSEQSKQQLLQLPNDELWQQFSMEFSIEVTRTSN